MTKVQRNKLIKGSKGIARSAKSLRDIIKHCDKILKDSNTSGVDIVGASSTKEIVQMAIKYQKLMKESNERTNKNG